MKDIEARHTDFEAAAKEDEAFVSAFGRFMLAWTDAEAELYLVLRHYAKVSDPIARAIFSGVRASGMIDFVRSIAENTELTGPRMDDLNFVLPQIKTIGTQRDHIVHFTYSNSFGWDTEPQRRRISNALRANRYTNTWVKKINSHHLDDMTADLSRIQHHLQHHWIPWEDGFVAWQENPNERTTWRHKSDGLVTLHPKKRAPSPRPKGQQKPSRAKPETS